MAGPYSSAITDFGGAASNLFAGFASQKKADMFRISSKADLLKGQGDLLEEKSYDAAHDLALKNKAFAAESTAVQGAQADRAITMSLGAARAGYGASGVLESGSAIDVLRASAQQSELEKAILQKQGVMAEESYDVQAESYGNMAKAAHIGYEGELLASEGHLKAAEAEDQAATGQFIGAGIKVLAGVAAIAAAPSTGGASLALGAALIPGNWGEQS